MESSFDLLEIKLLPNFKHELHSETLPFLLPYPIKEQSSTVDVAHGFSYGILQISEVKSYSN